MLLELLVVFIFVERYSK